MEEVFDLIDRRRSSIFSRDRNFGNKKRKNEQRQARCPHDEKDHGEKCGNWEAEESSESRISEDGRDPTTQTRSEEYTQQKEESLSNLERNAFAFSDCKSKPV